MRNIQREKKKSKWGPIRETEREKTQESLCEGKRGEASDLCEKESSCTTIHEGLFKIIGP